NAPRGVIIGYDTRFLSQHAARTAAEVIAGAGIPVQITSDSTPTPAISLAVKSQGAAGGVVVTSSHNPWNWNGVKFKARFGGSATPAIMKVIEEEVGAGAMPKGQVRGGLHVRFGTRRADPDFPGSRHRLRRHPAGVESAIPWHQSGADRTPRRNAAPDGTERKLPCRSGG